MNIDQTFIRFYIGTNSVDEINLKKTESLIP